MSDYEIPLYGGVSNLGNTAGTTGAAYAGVILVGGNNITLSQSLAGGVATITIHGAAGGGGGGIAAAAGGVTVSNNTLVFETGNGITFGIAGSTLTASHNGLTSQSNQAVSGSNGAFTFQTVSFGSSNGMHFYTTNGSIVGSYTVPTQTNQTLGFYAVGNTTGESSSTTFDARTISFRGDGFISLGYSNGTLRISGTQTNPAVSNAIQGVGSANNSGTNTSRFAADDHVHAGVFSVGVSNLGNSAGDTRVDVGRFVFVGGANITLSMATAANALNTISIIGGAGGGGNFSAGVSNLGNTAGATGITGTQLVLVGGANITLSQTTGANGATVSIIGGAGGGGITNINVSAGTTSADLSNLVFADANLVSFGLDGSTITAKAGGNTITRSFTDVVPQGSLSTFGQLGNGIFWVNFLPIDGNISISRMHHMASFSISSSSNSSHAGTLTMLVGIYTRTGSTLSLVTSGSGTYAWTNTSNNSMASLSAGRRLTAEIPYLFTEGDYWVAIGSRTSTANANWWTGSNFIMGGGNNPNLLGNFAAASTANIQQFPGQGLYSASSSVPPASMAISGIQASSAALRSKPVFNLANFGI